MAFLIPRNPLTPSHRLRLDIDPAARVVRAADLGAWRDAQQAVAAAHEQAQAIVAGAQAAYDAERERGHREGKEEASHELSTNMAEQYVRVARYYDGIEDQVASLVMQGVRRIIGGYSDHERVLHSARSALATVARVSRMRALSRRSGWLSTQKSPTWRRSGCVSRRSPGAVSPT